MRTTPSCWPAIPMPGSPLYTTNVQFVRRLRRNLWLFLLRLFAPFPGHASESVSIRPARRDPWLVPIFCLHSFTFRVFSDSVVEEWSLIFSTRLCGLSFSAVKSFCLRLFALFLLWLRPRRVGSIRVHPWLVYIFFASSLVAVRRAVLFAPLWFTCTFTPATDFTRPATSAAKPQFFASNPQ